MMPASFQELLARLQAIGWTLEGIDEPTKTTGLYVAKAKGPDGKKSVALDGATPEIALTKVLSFAQRHNLIRAYASLRQKIAIWQTPWANQMIDIARAYAEAPAYDKKAVPAWMALAQENAMQAQVLRNQLNVRVTDDPNPYPNPQAMMHDVHHKQNLIVSRANALHPLWGEDDVINHRIVHNALAHAQMGAGYTWPEEVKAVEHHMAHISPLARRALFTEELAQAANRHLNGSHEYGPQKIALLPEFLDPVERMNGEQVHVPNGKLFYPQEVLLNRGAWGWGQNPDGKWKQNLDSPEIPKAASAVHQDRIALAEIHPKYAIGNGRIPNRLRIALEGDLDRSEATLKDAALYPDSYPDMGDDDTPKQLTLQDAKDALANLTQQFVMQLKDIGHSDQQILAETTDWLYEKFGLPENQGYTRAKAALDHIRFVWYPPFGPDSPEAIEGLVTQGYVK